MIKTVEQRKSPVTRLKLLASERSEGKGAEVPRPACARRETDAQDSFQGGGDRSLLAGASRSLESDRRPRLRRRGRGQQQRLPHDPEIPLVVPEVNPGHRPVPETRIIANPNCSTIQMVVALKRFHDAVGSNGSWFLPIIRFRTGLKAIDELLTQTKPFLDSREIQRKVYPHQIAFNCLPHIDSFWKTGTPRKR